MRRLFTICLLVLSATALLVSAPAASGATGTKASKPSITRVLPMRVSVGGTLTITGKNFKSAHSKNTVIFRGPDGRTAFAKPRRASRTKLVVAVPAAVARLVARSSSAPKPTRFKLRVLSGSFSDFTSRRLSPVVVPANGGTGTAEVTTAMARAAAVPRVAVPRAAAVPRRRCPERRWYSGRRCPGRRRCSRLPRS